MAPTTTMPLFHQGATLPTYMYGHMVKVGRPNNGWITHTTFENNHIKPQIFAAMSAPTPPVLF